MTIKQRRSYCGQCEKFVLATGERPQHLGHAAMTVLTFGGWAWIWGGVTALGRKPFYCPECASVTFKDERQWRKFERALRRREFFDRWTRRLLYAGIVGLLALMGLCWWIAVS